MTIILQTERLILRTWEEFDLDAMTSINMDSKVCEFLPGTVNRNEELVL